MLTWSLLVGLLASAPSGPTPTCSHEDLAKQSPAELRLTRNHVFARHGRAFQSEDLKAHFGAQPWYREDPGYTDKRLTADDKACVARVTLWEESKGILWQAKADLDGDKKDEPIFLLALDERLVKAPKPGTQEGFCEPACKARLVVGDQSLPWGLNFARGSYWTAEEPYRVIDLDARDGRREIWLRQYQPTDVDPAYWNLFVTLTDGKLVASELKASDYNAGEIELLGEGRLRFRLSSCPEAHEVHELQRGKLKKVKTESKPLPRGGCAACPFVDVATEAGWARQGEILRYLVGPGTERWQRLSLEVPEGGRLRVRLREEKDEVTELDAVALRVGDTLVAPDTCGTSSAAYCTADGQRHVLRRGEELVLEFALPGARRGPVFLQARGFYVPTRER